MTANLADLLSDVTRDRAHAYAELAAARATISDLEEDLRQTRLDLCLAREILGHHGLVVVDARSMP